MGLLTCMAQESSVNATGTGRKRFLHGDWDQTGLTEVHGMLDVGTQFEHDSDRLDLCDSLCR